MFLTGLFLLPITCYSDNKEKNGTFLIPLLIFLILASLLILFFSFASFWDPGYVKWDPEIDFQDLLDKFSPLDMCPECKVIRTPWSWHCNICNLCVEWFDHHCPYINNCVGYNNHVYFLIFILMIVLNLIYNAILTIWSIYYYVTLDPKTFDGLKWDWFKTLYFNPVIYNVFYVLGIVINLAILVLFGIPTLILLVVHSWNFCKNMTTNERFSKQGGSR